MIEVLSIKWIGKGRSLKNLTMILSKIKFCKLFFQTFEYH